MSQIQRNFLQNKHKSFLCFHCWLTSDEHFVQKYAMHTKQQVVRKIKQREGKPPALPARGYASTQIPTPHLRQKPLLSKVKPGPRSQRNHYQGGLLALMGADGGSHNQTLGVFLCLRAHGYVQVDIFTAPHMCWLEVDTGCLLWSIYLTS